MNETAQELCSWCGKWYSGSECQKCAIDIWKSNRRNGCVMQIVLFPLAVAGSFLGLIFSGLKAGFDEGKGAWETASKFIRAKRPT
jgi:hypothetical protein